MRPTGVFAAFVLLALLHVGSAFGQLDKATVTELVTDQTGAVLPGVSIIATETGTAATFAGVTNNVGIYRITDLPIGDYTILLRHPGFKDDQSSAHRQHSTESITTAPRYPVTRQAYGNDL